MDGHDVVVAESHAIHRARFEILGKDVKARGQVEYELTSVGLFQVDAHGSLVQVVAQEGRPNGTPSRIGHRRQRGPTKLAGERFDLDDVSTEARQKLGGVGQGLHLLDGQHPDPLEGPTRCGDRSRLCRSELHLEYYIRTIPLGFAGAARPMRWSAIAP